MFSHRLQRGEVISITNLAGKIAEATIEGYDKQSQHYFLSIRNETIVPPPTGIILFQAILEKHYMDQWAEVIGLCDVAEVILFQADFSQPYIVDVERLMRINQRSLLLSERAYKPIIRLIRQPDLRGLLAEYRPAVLDADGAKKQASLSRVVIGPEGGFSDRERAMFAELDLLSISLGTHIYPGWIAGFVALQ